jgi:uncharacterized protein YdeI (YjbR/CyaY-like superfamily)
MGRKNPRIDNYIFEAAPFAQPILEHLRYLVHQACPDTEEAIKWGHIFFQHSSGYICNMGAFKKHCAFGFWLESKMDDPQGLLVRSKDKKKDSPLARITKPSDLPSDKILKQYIKQAMALLEKGAKLSRPKADNKAVVAEMPDYFTAALKTNPTARGYFAAFSPSAKKEYIQWLTEAKTAVTRNKRLATAIDWIADGKTRQWKYQR